MNRGQVPQYAMGTVVQTVGPGVSEARGHPRVTPHVNDRAGIESLDSALVPGAGGRPRGPAIAGEPRVHARLLHPDWTY
jgi:hypothetical protein